MGIGLSDNYENVDFLFYIGIWKVHKATRKIINDNVCLWQIDEEKLKQLVKNRTEKERYLKSCSDSIQQMRRLCHPHILKIYEFNESSFSFSSELFKYSLIYEDKFSNEEITYISSQLAETLLFLHNNVKVGHLSISPRSIVLTESFDIKICEFNFCSPIINDLGTIGPKYGEWNYSSFLPDLNFSSPELITNKSITINSDVFSFGCLISTLFLKRQLFSCGSSNELINQIPNISNQLPHNLNENMKELLSKCLSLNPLDRPNFELILKSNAFNNIQSKILKYLDLILTKDPSDKFTFFKGLLNSLSTFSNRLLKFKFTPLFIQEILQENRYAPILFPVIVQIGKNFTNIEFENEILKPCSSILIITKPPEIMLSIFSIINILMEKINPEKQYDIIYPIYLAALQSEFSKLHEEAIKNMPLVIKTMPQNAIYQSLIPKLLEFLNNSEDPQTLSSCVICLSHIIIKTDVDQFIEQTIPKISLILKRCQNIEFINSILLLFEKSFPNIDICFKFLIPLASEILSISNLPSNIQLKFITFISNALEKVKRERKLIESKWVEKAKKDLIEEKQIINDNKIEEDKIEFEKEIEINNIKPKKPLILPKKNKPPVILNEENLNESKKPSMFSGMNVNIKKK